MTNKNVPKLRFPEFLESWTTQKIDNIAKINDGTHTTPNYVDSGIKFISVENIEDFSKSNKFIEKEAYQKYKVKSKKNDIFLTRIGTIGESNILTEDETYAYYVSLALIRCNNEINPFYLNQYIKSEFFQRELWNKTLHNAVPKKINLNDLEQCLISFPRLLDEQNKIACFLFDIDKKIGLLKDKKEGFIEFKHYLLQNLFPQNGSCVPKLRFNKYHDDWDGYTLSDIGDCYNGLFGMKKEDFSNGDSKYITYKTIFDNVKIDVSSLEYVNLNDKKQNLVKKDDLFFTGSSETPEETGMVSVLENNVSDCYLNSFCFGYRLNDTLKFNSIFLGYYFRNPFMRKILTILSQGSTRFNLSKKEVLKIRITIPSTDEQEKIASFLSSVDKKIDLLDQEIEYVEEYKKGLLQKMFI